MMQYTQLLDEKKQNGSLRVLHNIDAVQRERKQAGAPFINLSSNDYLSLGDDAALRQNSGRSRMFPPCAWGRVPRVCSRVPATSRSL